MRGAMLAVVVAFLTFTLALVGGFMHAADVADEVTLANERSLLSNQIDQAIAYTAASQKVQLTWDDAMRAAGGQGETLNAAWTDTYLGQFLWTNLHAEYLFLVAPDGSLVRAWDRGKVAPADRYAPVAGGVRENLARMRDNGSLLGQVAGYRQLANTRWPVDAEGLPLSRWHGELGEYNGAPALISVVSVVPDANVALLKRESNSLVAVRLLGKPLLSRFSKALLLGDLKFARTKPVGGIYNGLEVKTRQGKQLGWLSWRPNGVGPIIVRRTLPLLLTYFAFYIVVLVIGIHMVRQSIRLAREYATREARAQRSALHDPMLGLPNRTMVLQRLAHHLAELKEMSGGEALFLAYLDLDHFKSINDTIGHHVGDELLFEVVKRLRGMIGEGDLLGRLASDEFVVLHRAADGRETAEVLGRRLMDAFAEPFTIMGLSLPVTASCGIAWGPEHSDNSTDLLRLADIALFRAKQRGRGRFRCFTEEMNSTIRWRQDMEVELRRAIASNDLAMLYQPIVHVADSRIVCFEALLRWTHYERGAISPAIFVPLAEQCGLMPQLGEWVLRRVFADSLAFDGAEISINLSPLQITAREFVPQLKALVVETGVDPKNFVFEITEGVLMDNSNRMLALLGEVRAMGFRIALDDFGTGFSSLAYLRSFQFDRIKVDRSFVQGIESDFDAQAILKTIVSLGRTLRMKVIAEGVETMLQQQLVEASGCQLIQGHLHWRALTLDRAVELLAPHSNGWIRRAG